MRGIEVWKLGFAKRVRELGFAKGSREIRVRIIVCTVRFAKGFRMNSGLEIGVCKEGEGNWGLQREARGTGICKLRFAKGFKRN